MTNKFIITKFSKEEQSGILSAYVENGKTVELSFLPDDKESILGNIYVGRVKNIAKNIEAAFIDIGDGRVCYYSLKDIAEPIYVKRGNSKNLCAGDEILVQVSKDAIKTKAPAVTENLNFSGKYLVLTTGKKHLGYSSKLSLEQKQSFKKWIEPLYDGSFGMIVRTNASEASEEELKREYFLLKNKLEKVVTQGIHRTCFSLVYEEETPYFLKLRSLGNEMPLEIITDVASVYEEVAELLKIQNLNQLWQVQLYEDQNLSLMKLYSLETVLTEATRERVWLKSGGYLIIQPTEALTVIDVNTGKFETGKKKEATFLKINIEAAKMIATQLRIRDISGIVIVDFINMSSKEANEELLNVFAQEVRKDPVKTNVIGMTTLGLVELTRKRTKKSLKEELRLF